MAEATHVEREDHGWAIDIPDHPARTESEEFRRAKETVHKILAAVRAQPGQPADFIATFAGDGAVQAHHAGSLWLFTDGVWFLVLNAAGVEWSAQWAALPARIDALRQNAKRVYDRFPETLGELERLGYTDAREILETPITDHVGVARWTDSLFNSCVPLTALLHQGEKPAQQQVGGWHHYPKSIWDQQVTKRDDFNLWVTDEDGHEVAVAPMGHRGSGDSHVRVQWAHPASRHHAERRAHHQRGEEYVLPGDHLLAQQAFARQRDDSAEAVKP